MDRESLKRIEASICDDAMKVADANRQNIRRTIMEGDSWTIFAEMSRVYEAMAKKLDDQLRRGVVSKEYQRQAVKAVDALGMTCTLLERTKQELSDLEGTSYEYMGLDDVDLS